MTYAPYIIISAYLGGIVLFGIALWLEAQYQNKRRG